MQQAALVCAAWAGSLLFVFLSGWVFLDATCDSWPANRTAIEGDNCLPPAPQPLVWLVAAGWVAAFAAIILWSATMFIMTLVNAIKDAHRARLLKLEAAAAGDPIDLEEAYRRLEVMRDGSDQD